ncbi:rhomboid family intramembrane serine protease [Pararhodonellum marinum]|uniref:rhomboid family intramembrane serine protease n=1 Tax=Pararhodonellum marinum TaxID=2755358 RepID=UPI00188EC347|nr:rhomboid family intramembrane serine protease [Pararhodonellum marinum]
METYATYLIIGLTVLSSYKGFKDPSFVRRWMFTPYKIKQNREYDRFILSGFIHKDQIHLFFNMFTFFFFGRLVEQFLTYRYGLSLGILIYVFFYLSSIVVSDIPTFRKHKDNPTYHALGASGGASAVVFASIMLVPLADICLFGLFCVPGFILGVLFIIYSVVMARKDMDAINHDAHLYGALFGIIFILILTPESAVDFIRQISNYRPF